MSRGLGDVYKRQDEEYNVTVTGDDMKKQVTIGDLYNLVSSRL